MPSLYAKWMYAWETRLTTRDTNRVVRPLEWGMEWARGWPLVNGDCPDAEAAYEAYLHQLNDRIVTRSDEFFAYLRDACPCAMCDEERSKTNRHPGDPPHLAPGALPMFKPAAKPLSAEAVGKYAIKFNWNDGHELGIYSWEFLREICQCEQCTTARGVI